MFDLYREKGPGGLAMALPAVFGVGVQTYGNQVPTYTTTPTGRPKVEFRQPTTLGEELINRLTGTQVSNVPPEHQQALIEAREIETRHKIELDKAKALVLETGEPQVVDDTEVFLDNGIVKVRKVKGATKTPTVESLMMQFLFPEKVEDQIRKLSARSGARARKIHEFLQNKSDAEKEQILSDWEAKGIITDEVYDQLLELTQ